MIEPNTNAMKYLSKNLPDESCGFILRDGSFVASGNIVDESPDTPHHLTREMSFLIDHKDYIEYYDAIEYIVHSHYTDGDGLPSYADVMHQEATGMPWLIYVFSLEGKLKDIHEIR